MASPPAACSRTPPDWRLSNGAKIVETIQPDGSTGGVLELPGKGQATSPVMCITTDYPMARVWSRTVNGNDLVSFNVQYLDKGTGQWTGLKNNGAFAGPVYWNQGFDWSSYTDWAVAWAEYANSQVRPVAEERRLRPGRQGRLEAVAGAGGHPDRMTPGGSRSASPSSPTAPPRRASPRSTTSGSTRGRAARRGARTVGIRPGL